MTDWKVLFQNTSAVCDGPLESYVLGTHEWRIEGDNVQCSAKGEAYTATLKLTGCREGEFTCYDGQCIRTVVHENILYFRFLYFYFRLFAPKLGVFTAACSVQYGGAV